MSYSMTFKIPNYHYHIHVIIVHLLLLHYKSLIYFHTESSGEGFLLSLPHLNGHPKFKNFILERALTDKSPKQKVTSDKNFQTQLYHDCMS